MEVSKTFSIIIPVYNVSMYLVDCLNSVLSQDVDRECYEIIIVDDCSPYGEKEVVNDFLQQYHNIKYIRHDVNKRQGGARNTGMRAACGEYVIFLDGDDCFVYKNVLSILLEYVKKYKPLILRSERHYQIESDACYSELGNKIGDIYVKKEGFACISCSFIEWRSEKIGSVAVWGTLYKRQFLLENGLFFRENTLFEDTDWTQKVLFCAERFDFMDFPYYGYRQSPDSATRGRTVEAFCGAVDGVIESYGFYKNSIDKDDPFWCVLREIFVEDTINLLMMSRNYAIVDSLKILGKLNECELTNLKSKNWKNNVILSVMSSALLLIIVLVKILVVLKRLFVSPLNTSATQAQRNP